MLLKRRLTIVSIVLAFVLLSADALAQAPPIRSRNATVTRQQGKKKPADKGEEPELPGASGPLPETMEAIAKATETPYKPKPGSHRIKFNLQDADLAELVNHISGLTGKRFIYGAKVRQIKVTVVSPTPVSLNEAYEAFLSILSANGMTVVPHGRFLEIVDSGGIVTDTTPVYSRAAPTPDTDRFITRLYRLSNVSPTEVAQLLNKFKSKEGDISVYEPGGLLIMTDSGANIRRMVRIIEEVDVGGAEAEMWIEPVHYGNADEIAKQVNEIFELGGKGGGASAGGLMRVLADEQTNSLVVVGSEPAYGRLIELLRRIDTAPAADGKIHVLALQHAVAEELAGTLTQMLSGAQRGQRGRNQKGAAGNAGGMFEGEVRVTADKSTNSLVVTSSARDFAQVRLVVEKLDQERRQVFIEAVIMDVSVDRTTNLGLSYHGGATADLGGSSKTIFLGGFNPVTSIVPSPQQLQGLALGVRGPDLSGTTNQFPGLAGVSIPAFGVVLNALTTTGDVNILATPHIIATDNTTAEINVGENIPLQTNFAGGFGNLGALAGLSAASGGGQSGGGGALAGLGALGGFGNAPRQDVGIRIRVTPHINDEDQVRLEIEEEFSQPGASSGALGAVSITQRTANTTIVVDDQQTIVIGGLMRDDTIKSKQKIPVLGDLPVLGFLFRNSKVQHRKANLLLILTPYVIRGQADLRKVFERKMQERQEFIDRYFVFESEWEPPLDMTRTNGLVEKIRQAHMELEERRRLEEELEPEEELKHERKPGINLPMDVRSTQQPSKVRKKKRRRKPRRRRRKKGDASPIRINPVARSVNVERME